MAADAELCSIVKSQCRELGYTPTVKAYQVAEAAPCPAVNEQAAGALSLQQLSYWRDRAPAACSYTAG